MTIASLANRLKSSLSPRFSPSEIHSIYYGLLQTYCEVSITEIIANPGRELLGAQVEKILSVEEQLMAGIPWQYAVGKTHFYGITVRCAPGALIPRPETEELVAWILSAHDASPESIIDIGTGTGCIALALKHNRATWSVSALDVSSEALRLAKENGESLGIDVSWIEADIRDLPSVKKGAPFSIIVSNPPYVLEQESLEMEANVLDHEPHLALFVPNDDPLLFYNYIMDWALVNACHQAWLYVEINPTYSDAIVLGLEQRGFINIEVKKDLQGKYRMIRGQIVFLGSES